VRQEWSDRVLDCNLQGAHMGGPCSEGLFTIFEQNVVQIRVGTDESQ
jgi:hypothetical protein